MTYASAPGRSPKRFRRWFRPELSCPPGWRRISRYMGSIESVVPAIVWPPRVDVALPVVRDERANRALATARVRWAREQRTRSVR